jgi:hypothetical protein
MAISPPFDPKNDGSNGRTIQIIGLYPEMTRFEWGGGFFVAVNPASPISRYSEETVLSEEVPEG